MLKLEMFYDYTDKNSITFQKKLAFLHIYFSKNN